MLPITADELSTLVEHLPAALFQVRYVRPGEWMLIYASAGIEAVLGISRQQFDPTGASIMASIAAPDRANLSAAARTAAQTHMPLVSEFRFTRPDGALIALRCHAQPTRQSDGSEIWSGVLTDISELYATRQALQENEARLRLALTAANQGLYDVSLVTGEAQVNDEYARMLGYDPATFVESNAAWLARMHPDDYAATLQHFQDYVGGVGSAYKVEFRQRTRDGHWKWILSQGRIVERDANGNPVRMLGTHTDISERKRREAQLQESEERLALATLHNGIGIWDLDLKTRRLVWDESMYALYRVSKDEFSGTEAAWRATLHPDDLARADLEVSQAIAKGAPLETEYRVCWPTGEVRYIKIVAKTFLGPDGAPARMLGTNTDITDRKVLEIALRHQAHTDHLTGVGSRGYFMEQAELELNRALRYGNALSLFMLDIDFFKAINDAHGHRAGDAVLRALATICRQTLREVDVIGRVGGEEFAMLLPKANATAAVDVAERLRTAVEATTIEVEPGIEVRFTVSIGVTSAQPRERSIDKLIKRADEALYAAKRQGRNRVCVAPLADATAN